MNLPENAVVSVTVEVEEDTEPVPRARPTFISRDLGATTGTLTRDDIYRDLT